MFRRARLSVKPNVRPGVGARGSAAPHPQRGSEAPRPPEPAEFTPKPAEPAHVSAVDSGGAGPQEKAPGSSDAKTDGENNVEASSKSSSTVSQRRKRISSTSSLVKPAVSVPLQPQPLSTVNQDTPQPNPIPTKEKQPCSDRYRIYKAQKLREMLKEELRKEKKQWKNKFATNESQRPPDRSKMTMRDFIYYLPDSNPMTSSLEQEKKTEKSLTLPQTQDRQENKSTPDAEDNEEVDEEVDDGPLLVPRVKVAEDGSIILDEESLTVEVLRTKGPCVVEENDPIFERGSTTTYSSFRKNYYSKPWSNKETDMFFLAISMVGTDFSMIGQLFPHRARIEIKNKFKREEKTNGWRIDKAFQEKRPFDFDFFAHLLQKVLAEEEKRKQKPSKSQTSKEKSSKPRKIIKAKKATSEGVNDDPDESVGSNISDPERSQKDAQTVDEEEVLTSPRQDLEQVTLEDQNRKKRRKNQDEANKQEAKNLSENACVQPGTSEVEIPKSKCPSEAIEGECNEEQTLSFPQNVEDIVGLTCSEKAEMRADPVSSTCNQQDTTAVATESSESSAADLQLLAVGISASGEVGHAERSGEERGADLENETPHTDQTENVKPKLRSRLQRPKPNLSRAVGKKSVDSQGKTDEESKNLPSETPIEKNPMEKEKVNISESLDIENTERQNSEAETVTNLSEKICPPEDNHPEVFRPARLLRGRMQRPKPNVKKAAERKEILTSQEKIGANIKKNENESCVDGEKESCADKEKDEFCIDREKNESSVAIPQQIENEPCKNFQCEDTILQPEKNSTSENVHPVMSQVLNECPSIQEDNKANKLKQAPVLRTRFWKPKPNIGRRIGRRGMSSEEEVPEESPVSGEMTAALEKILRPNTSPSKTLPDVTILPSNTTDELESDLKETGRSNTFNKQVSEMNDVTVEMDVDLESVGRGISMDKVLPEMSDITMETNTGLEASLNKISPMEKVPELIDTTEEIDKNLEGTERREIFPQKNDPKEVSPVNEMETDLQEPEKEMLTRERTVGITDISEQRETGLEETEREMSALKAPEEDKTIGEMETCLKITGGEASQRKKLLVESIAVEENEIDWKETERRDMSMLETLSAKMTPMAETSTHVKETGREISVSQESGSEEICVSEKVVTDLEKTGKIDVFPREHGSEEHSTSKEPEAGVIQSIGEDSSPGPSQDSKNISNKIPVMTTFVEEKENGEKRVSSPLSPVKSSQNSGHHETDQGIRLPDALGQFSDINLRKSLPQEQKPLEVKPVPFLRSRFKRPKPNLARATVKRGTPETEQGTPGKKSETEETESMAVQQARDHAAQPESAVQDVSSLMTSRENDKSGYEEEAVILPCIETEKDPSPSNSCEPKEESQLTQNQEKGLLSMGTQKMNIVPEETKQSVFQSALPVRGRLHRPRPNVQKARQRQIVEKGDVEGIAKEEATIAQEDETRKKSLTVSNSQIETEIEVVSSKVSECRVNENQDLVVCAENFKINKSNILDEKIRHENKPYVPSPAQLIRRRFQKAKPNLRGAHDKKEQLGVEKDTTAQHEAQKPENNLLQKGDSDNLPKEKADIPTSLEISARKDCVGSKESDIARKDTKLKLGSSGSVGEETLKDNSVSSVSGEQNLSKQTSHPQLLKESNFSKIAPHQRTTLSSASECEREHTGKRMPRKSKPNMTKGRGSKRIRGKTKKEPRASKSMLVTLRASQNEDEDDAEDFESEYEEDTCHLAPEELNKAPVFVPVGLRSPELISAQIEETMEELEITLDAADVGSVTVIEHQLPDPDVATQEVQQEKCLQTSSFEMTISQQTQDQPGPSDGSTEAAIALLTMGEIVLQSELITEQSDVGVCVYPDVHSKDKSHVPFSPDNVNPKIVHEYQELSSPVISVSPASFEENKIVSNKQNTKEEAGLMEEAMENTLPARDTASAVTKNLRMKSRFIKPKPNLEKIFGTSGFHGCQEAPSFCVTKGTEVEIQNETEKNDSKPLELEAANLGPVTAAENKEQKQLACLPDVRGTSISQEANLTARDEDQEERSQDIQMSIASVTSSEIRHHTLESGQDLDESSAEEPLRESSKDSMSVCHVPERTPTRILEIQEENVISPEDLTVYLSANTYQDGEDEQAFILTLVEIPTNGAEGFTDTLMQSMPGSLLPAPILVKTGTTIERSGLSGSLQATSAVQDAMYLSHSGSDDSEKPPANLDLISRKRVHQSSDEYSHVPPAKKSSLASGVYCQECATEVHSEELNVFQKPGESCGEQGIFCSSESIPTTPEPQKEQVEPSFQNIDSRSLDEIRDKCIDKNTTQLPQDEMVVSNKEEKTEPASNSEHMDSRTSSLKPPLSRFGRRPLGFLSLICPKNSLDSDEVTQIHSKKRLKPHIPVSRRNLKRSNPLKASQKKNPESSAPLPSPSVTDTQSENTSSSLTQVSSDQPSLKEKCKNEQKRASDEEATTISEYFFGDIFIQVNETE